MTLEQISIEKYFNMNEEEKQDFYNRIKSKNPRSHSITKYATKINPAKQSKIPQCQHHQPHGHLQFIAPLCRSDTTVSGLYFLVVCDCGRWAIVEGIKYRNEEQKQCITCSLSNMSSMKNITGEIYGQLQAIAPLEKRAKDGSVYWLCKCIDCGHEQEVVKSNLRKNSGHLCAVCGEKSKGEFKVAKMLQQLHLPFEKEKIFTDCIFANSNAYARFDFYVNNSYIIEVDGQHHFFPVTYGGKMSQEDKEKMYYKVLQHDRQKNQYCRDNNIPIIRIPYFALDTLTEQDLLIETSKFLII